MKGQINRGQVITVQKYKRWAKLDEPTYRDLLDRAAGVGSSKFLSQRQFDTVMSWIEALLWDRVDAGAVPAPAGVQRFYWRHKAPASGMMNSRLRWKMERWWGMLADYLPEAERNADYLAGIIRKACGHPLETIVHEGCMQWEQIPQSAAVLALEAIKDRLRHAVPKGAAAA
ncbi:MAG: DUF1018 domain-containing protein [Kiritimatiellaeota bacterium]|nr:DUF1018 domain-containing protein [Kiritimatiellota bacterium]